MSAPLPVYLDNAATTPLDPRVVERMARCLDSDADFGNPASTTHVYGERARALVDAARVEVAAAIGCAPRDVIFTSGATEANNLAIFGIAEYYRRQGRHIVTARTEHKAVLDPCRELERRGWQVTYLAPDARGLIDPDRVAGALRRDTVLVSIMHVNNEIGLVHDIAAIAERCRAHDVPLHVDAAQSVGKCKLDIAACALTLASVSAHKAYGPKGIGALVLAGRGERHLQPLLYGGGQEHGLRPGTLATHQIVGMGAAFAIAERDRREDRARIAELRDRLWSRIRDLGALSNSDPAIAVPHILNVSFDGVEGESLIAALRARVATSSGSACMSATGEPSYVLRALGRSERLSQASLRLSLGRFTTAAEIDAAAGAIREAVERLRAIAGMAHDRAR